MAVGYPHSRLVARLRAIVGLSADDAARIERLPIKLQNFGPDYDIVREGESLDQCCMLVDGFLMRQKDGAEGQRQIVSWHVPGDIPDLYSLHLNPIDHNITTLGSVVVGFIPHQAMHEVLGSSASLTHIFWRETLVDAAVFREWVVNLGKRGALARIAHVLCELHARLKVVGLAPEDHFVFPASQVDISDATGMTPVHANRMIQELRASGAIQWDGPRIRIRDLAQLQSTGRFDPPICICASSRKSKSGHKKKPRHTPCGAARPAAAQRGICGDSCAISSLRNRKDVLYIPSSSCAV
jgi:CRP-like cAMP-binding protein